MEGISQLLLSPLPEGGPVVEIKADQCAAALGVFGNGKAGFGGVFTHGGDQAGDVQDLYALLFKNALQVKVLGGDRSSHFAGPVVPHSGSPAAKPGIGNIELVAIAPGAALGDAQPFEGNVSGSELTLDVFSNGASLHEFRESKAWFSQA